MDPSPGHPFRQKLTLISGREHFPLGDVSGVAMASSRGVHERGHSVAIVDEAGRVFDAPQGIGPALPASMRCFSSLDVTVVEESCRCCATSAR